MGEHSMRSVSPLGAGPHRTGGVRASAGALVTVGAIVLGAIGAAPATAGEAPPSSARADTTASAVGSAAAAEDSFDPTSRAAVALVLVALFAARRSRTRVSH